MTVRVPRNEGINLLNPLFRRASGELFSEMLDSSLVGFKSRSKKTDIYNSICFNLVNPSSGMIISA